MHLEAGNCLRCGEHIDGHSGVEDEAAQPYPGALSICAYCGKLAMFASDDGEALYLRELSDEEREEWGRNPEVIKVVAAIMMVRAQRTFGVGGSD